MKKLIFLLYILNFANSFAALNGTYTINPLGGNYTSISAAINALYTQGVSGPVIFNIAPETYNEHVVLNGGISGASAVNKITFQKNPLLVGTVNIRNNPTVSDDFINDNGNVIKLKGVSYINLKNITLTVLSPNYTDNQWGGILSIIENSNYITVDSCNFIGENTLITTELARNGIKVFRSNNVLVSNSNINSVNGISFYQSENCIARNNNLNVYSSGFYGNQCDNFDFYNNKIFATCTQGFSSTALTVQGHMGVNPNGRRAVYNNFIQTGATGIIVSGDFLNTNSNENLIYNNSILSNSGYGINILWVNLCKVKNNIIQANSGLVVRVSNSSTNVDLLNNNLYPSTATFSCSILGVNYSNISSMTGISGFNISGNININPGFIDIATNNLHTNTTALQNAGTTEINSLFDFDIDNENRVGNPDIGADEMAVVIPSCTNPNTLKVLLEGAYNSILGEMNSNLTSIIPLNQPYNNTPWNYNGNESITTVPDNMVDWVLVEVRSNDKCTVLARKSAILRKDGFVLNPDGSCALTFNGLAAGSYYFVVRHRNHLAIISNALVPYPFTSVYDFSSSVTQAFQNIQKLVSTKAVMYVGDFNADGIINVTDFNIYASQASALNQYLQSDANLDKSITVADYNLYNPNASIIGPSVIRLSGSTSDCGYLSPILPPVPPMIYNDWVLPSTQLDGKIYLSVKGGSGIYYYKWQKELSNGTLSKTIATTKNISNLGPAIYLITVTDSKGRIVTKKYEVKGIQSSRLYTPQNNNLIIYPNPLKLGNNLQINANNISNENLSLEIYSIDGKLVWNLNELGEGQNSVLVNTSNFVSGLYLVMLRDKDLNLIESKKFVVE